MISVFDNKTQCCGCEACRQVCPVQCIAMIEDEKGFIYPHIDTNRCIDCGKCRRTCLFHNEIVKEPNDYCYVYVNNNEAYREKSSSSGAFEVLSKAFCNDAQAEDIVVYGCELDAQFQARHNYSLGFEEIEKFKKSKYLQSRIYNSFLEIKNFLEDGKQVVFSGTPCQVQGLKLLLKKDYANLLTLDILCHGVPNQLTFSQYLKALEKKYGSKVTDYQFRYKQEKDGKWSNLNVRIRFKKKPDVVLDCSKDMFMMVFLAGILNRPSCGNCPFASTGRVSDVTMGDFWGIEDTLPELSEVSTNGTSLLLFNTMKGKKLIEKLETDAIIKKLPLETATPYNGQLTHPQKISPKNETFFKNIRSKNGFMKGMVGCYPHIYSKGAIIRNKLYTSKLYIALSRIKKAILK